MARKPLGLGTFLDELEGRLRALGYEGLVAAVLAHAQTLSAAVRADFLGSFSEASPREAGDDEQLLAEIESFSQRAMAGEFGDRDHSRYHDRFYDDDDEHDVDEWVWKAGPLFTKAGRLFLAGRLATAYEAYGRLFSLFQPDRAPAFDTWKLDRTDLPEAAARYLRSAYEINSSDQRVGAMLRAYATVLPCLYDRTPMLREIMVARRGGLPDLDAFLPAWIEALRADKSLPIGQPRRLLAEAAMQHGGIDALEVVARRPGRHQPELFLDLITELEAAGQLRRAADAARAASRLKGSSRTLKSKAADRLASLCSRIGEPHGAVDGAQHAWRLQRTRRRLVTLIGTAEAADVRYRVLTAEARLGRARTDRLSCELFLLAGQVDAAAAALSRHEPLGWSRSEHPGSVVVPYLLAAATGAPPRDGTKLAELFNGIDGFRLDLALDPSEFEPETMALAPLLAARVSDTRAPERQRRQWLATAMDTIERRVETIVRGKHRGSYGHAAGLVVACAEVLTLTGIGDGPEYIATVRKRYPRHIAFREELDAAVCPA
jgi:hypothetical protein